MCTQVHFAALSLCPLPEEGQSISKGWGLGGRSCTVLLISDFISSVDRNTDGFAENPFHFLWLIMDLGKRLMEIRSN